LKKQTFKDFKVYIVYDGSTDNTLEIIKKYQKELSIVVADYKPTARVGLNKNRVVAMALRDKPNYIQMIDADDKVLPRFLEVGVERIKKGDVDWVITWGRLFGGRKGYIHSEIPTLDELMKDNNKLHSWGMFKSEILENRNFSKKLTSGVDWKLWIDLTDDGCKGTIIKKELYLKRWHDKSITVVEGKKEKKHFRFHLLGLVHLPCTRKYMSCAFTQKNYKLAQMLLSLGHEVIYYGAEGSNVPCTKFVQTHTLRDIRQDYGDGDNRFEIGYDWTNCDFRHDFNTKRKPATLKFYAKCIEEINKAKKDDDFLLCTQGPYFKPIANAVNLFLTCEPGIGYRGSYMKFRAFESSYIQSFTYGSEHPRQCINGSYYDRVIPNYFDPKDFEYSDKKDDYYFFIGRMIKRKGIMTAYLVCEYLKKKLIIAGQGAHVDKRGYLIPNKNPDFELPPGHWEYVGFVDVPKRKKLMAHAIATFTPTEYLECFAGTHVESMLSGTPPITTNFAVFPGTLPDYFANGIVGFRCNTLNDFVEAAKKAQKMTKKDYRKIRKYGERFLMDNVKWEFEKWFRDLMMVYESAIDSTKKGWHRIYGI